MTPLRHCVCLSFVLKLALSAPANNFVFPEDGRREKKLEPVITPPVLPVLEHLERDPSTLLPHERRQQVQTRNNVAFPNRGREGARITQVPPVIEHHERTPGFLIASASQQRDRGVSRGGSRNSDPRFGFGGSFNVAPSGNGGLTASLSSSASGAGASHSASQSFSFGFNQGFSASQSASQSSSFNGFNSGFSGSQASSQSASFAGNSVSAASSSAAAFGGGGSGSQSSSSTLGFNSVSDTPNDEVNFGDGLLDIRHRGAPNFPFPGSNGRGRSVGASAFTSGPRRSSKSDNWLAILVSD